MEMKKIKVESKNVQFKNSEYGINYHISYNEIIDGENQIIYQTRNESNITNFKKKNHKKSLL